jgi:hypothetical protein
VGLLGVSLPSYQGPLLRLTGGVDCSFLLSGAVGGAVYLVLTLGQESPRAAADVDESEAALSM